MIKQQERKREGRRVDDGAKQTEEMHGQDERDRKERLKGMTAGVKGKERGEKDQKVSTGQREKEERNKKRRHIGEKREREEAEG